MIWLESLVLYLIAMMIQTDLRPRHFSGPQMLSGFVWSTAWAWHGAAAHVHGLAGLPS
ncbi:MAG: hypothetical protein KGL17_03855 [Betaproteobacteria bacterium]|nr:hypothetical protein [Betaproteobacteria bacterium]MDE2131237.1 hypothetical protein [Betaproteobacteria bacterium]MDE2211831.1 hypothetical protein [Betaproteobacteria bacterium]MDE2354138.1 hypothetical protein [Betaproteobacteria bacterium]